MLSDSTFATECPSCGKHTLIKHQDGVYRCLACEFKKDFNQPESKSSGAGVVFAIVLFVILMVTIASEKVTSVCAPNDLQCQQEQSNQQRLNP